ncbi:ly6/PLAUR domain-containing protein 2-like [Montipora capricornis]|uniref:ly6/PLAUR domain-containing protein 2-like n=1 Tax=Montipora capricornis TaxID=246305 RepID=UPI0035F18B6C
MKTLFALAFLFCFSFASGLKCNVCTSTTSLEDCDKGKKEIDCGSNFDRCLTFTTDFSTSVAEVKSFVRSCQTKAYCDTSETLLKPCNDAGGKCKLDCCDTDLCNGGSAPVVSVLLMVVCAAMSLLR